jgi:hypothetical protein
MTSSSKFSSEAPALGTAQSDLISDDCLLSQLTGNESIAPGVLSERRKNVGRRKRSLGSLIRGNSRPRRRLSRRHDDQNLLLLDFYEPRMVYLALAIVLLSCTDAFFTLNLLGAGAEEVNLVMKTLLERSVGTFMWVKMALTGGSVILLVVLAQRRFMGWFRVVRVLEVACAGYAALIVYEIVLLVSVTSW